MSSGAGRMLILRYILPMALVTVAGCATLETKKDYLVTDLPEPDRLGVYHKVKKGETLWQIAKTYNATIGDVIRTNRIPNVAKIEENQLVFIPGAQTVKDVASGKQDASNEFVWPVKGKVLRYFHERNGSQLNKGIDIQAQSGDAVKAARGGRVVFADRLSGYGYTVILDHADEFYSVYARNAKLLVKLNDPVRQGQEIAEVATTGHIDHVHFEIRKNSFEDNPLYYLP